MRVNRAIRVPKVRVIGPDGKQVGVLNTTDALLLAQQHNLDLVEISPNAVPPVCKIVDFGKFRYEQSKKEKEAKKGSLQVKVKEIKVKPQTDDNDLNTKTKQARDFLEKGCKVRVTCVFRGREMQHTEFGERVLRKVVDQLADIAQIDAEPKLMGKNMSLVLMPRKKREVAKEAAGDKPKQTGDDDHAEDENE